MSKIMKKAISEGGVYIDEHELDGFHKEASKYGYEVIIDSFIDGVVNVLLWKN